MTPAMLLYILFLKADRLYLLQPQKISTVSGAESLQPEDKDASLFPRSLTEDGRCFTDLHLQISRWVRIYGLSFSPDLKHWGDSAILLPARKGSWWDAYKVGLGPQPIETPEGWLIIYHGVKTTAAGGIYRSTCTV
jgi:predicted GH43/DUF377 family glycosyl hydrolase